MVYNLKDHYQIEKKLALQLRNAGTEERKELYSELYDKLFRRVPLHPMLVAKSDPELRNKEVAEHLGYLSKFLNNDTIFAEVGPGDCALSFTVAKQVKQVYAIDVSEILSQHPSAPDNFKLILSDGTSISVPDNSVNVIYSNQLMEHLHPDDAKTQLHNIYNALTDGGIYFCETPNKLDGPHDVSFSFDQEATCFHLKEYTTTELVQLFKSIGFSKTKVVIGAHGIYLTIPPAPISFLESLLSVLPHALRTRIARTKILGALLDIRIIGYK